MDVRHMLHEISCLASDVVVEAYDTSGIRQHASFRAKNYLPIHPFVNLFKLVDAEQRTLENTPAEIEWFESLPKNCSQIQLSSLYSESVIECILRNLPWQCVLKLARVCTKWKAVSSRNEVWESKAKKIYPCASLASCEWHRYFMLRKKQEYEHPMCFSNNSYITLPYPENVFTKYFQLTKLSTRRIWAECEGAMVAAYRNLPEKVIVVVKCASSPTKSTLIQFMDTHFR
eukprot:Phypoly_transcript_16290.p1 GENE.Phypoly_transcript_16290~~Phypoly_transcript_16290.p1  ORF type:complete len:230 (+),score=14.38 Phypoly_transcript_16290:87-776(+)